MADFGKKHQLRTMEASGSLVDAGLKAQEFEMKGKASASDFAGRLAAMAANAQKGAAQAGLKLDAFGVEAAAPADPHAGAVREAKKLLKDKKVKEALEVLARVLKQAPTHHEAIYLAAYCYVLAGKMVLALKLLHKLAGARLANELGPRVEALRAAIRKKLLPEVVACNQKALDARKFEESLKQLRELVGLDPEVVDYHYMLAGTLLAAEDASGAMAVVENGLRACAGQDCRTLLELQAELLGQLLGEHLEPVREAYVQGDYSGARGRLQGVPADYHKAPLFLTLTAYLERLAGGGFFGWVMGLFGRSPAHVEPAGGEAELEAMHNFLVGPQLRAAQVLMMLGDHNRALEVLRKAHQLAPFYPFASYLLAACHYRRFWQAVAQQAELGLDDAIAGMQEGVERAEFAQRDPELADAGHLCGLLREALAQLLEVRKEMEAREQDTHVVNPLIEEFLGIMQSAQGGLTSVTHFDDVNGRMRALSGKLPRARGRVTSQEAIEFLDMLTQAVQEHLQQLAELEPEMRDGEIVEKHVTAFTGMMDLIQSGGGISTAEQFHSAQAFFQSLSGNVAADRRRVTSAQARRNLDELAAAIERVLAQFRGH